MRGSELGQVELFAVGSLEARVPAEHPLRAVRRMTEQALAELEPVFAGMYAAGGRPSVPPGQLLRALLLQMLYSVRSERMLIEQLEYNLLFRWFVGLGYNEAVWDATTFSKNRDRLLKAEVARRFFEAVLSQARHQRLLSDEHFTVDGSLIEAWASEKSYTRKPDPPAPGGGSGRRGEVLLRDSHQSSTDPDATMYRKNMRLGWRLSHMAHAVSENLHGLIVATSVSGCSPRAEREHGVKMLGQLGRVKTVVADRAYHEQDFVQGVQALGGEAHVPPYRRAKRKLWVDPALYQTERYGQSQKKRKWIERFFSWIKHSGRLRKTRHTGHPRLHFNFTLAAAAYNLVRMRRLMA
jgi:transposase